MITNIIVKYFVAAWNEVMNAGCFLFGLIQILFEILKATFPI
jgi:hypothetical protein